MSARHPPKSEREQLELFRALPGDLTPRDAQDLMAYPFFSLAKSHRTTPIDFRMRDALRRLFADPSHGQEIRDDLRSGLSTLPIWMQEFLRDLLGPAAAEGPRQ